MIRHITQSKIKDLTPHVRIPHYWVSMFPCYGMEMFTSDTGGSQLETGVKYVAFMSAVEYLDGIRGSGSVGSVGIGGGDVYGTGDFAHQNSADTSQFTTGGWNVAEASTVDLAFTATFSPVPIPAAVWLFGSSLLGLIGVARRRADA